MGVEIGIVPAAYEGRDGVGNCREQDEPKEVAASVGDDRDGYDERADRASEVAAHLEDGLGQTTSATGGERGDARGFGMDYRGAYAYGEHGEIYAGEVGGQREADDAEQGEGGGQLHAATERFPVEKHAHERLEHRCCELVDEGDRAYLREVQFEVILYYRICRGDGGLQQVVDEMGDAQRDQHGHCGPGGSFYSGFHRGAKIINYLCLLRYSEGVMPNFCLKALLK